MWSVKTSNKMGNIVIPLHVALHPQHKCSKEKKNRTSTTTTIFAYILAYIDLTICAYLGIP